MESAGLELGRTLLLRTHRLARPAFNQLSYLMLMSFVLVRDRSRLGHKPDYRHGWSPEYVRKSMYACRSVSVVCRPAEKRRQRGEIGSIHRSILVGHRRPNRRQRVNPLMPIGSKSNHENSPIHLFIDFIQAHKDRTIIRPNQIKNFSLDAGTRRSSALISKLLY